MRRIPYSDLSVERMARGLKTQTRRVAKWLDPGLPPVEQCPYGLAGERLRGLEAWRITRDSWCLFQTGVLEVTYRTGLARRRVPIGFDDAKVLVQNAGESWHPPRFMFNWASRFDVVLVSVSAQRVADITEADVRAEGIATLEEYRRGWDEMNARRGFPFDSNPVVWAIETRFDAANDFLGDMDDVIIAAEHRAIA